MHQLPEQLEKFLKQTGRTGARALSYLGKHQGIIQALETDLGKELLKNAVERHEYLARRVLDGEATDIEKSERKALFEILNDWSILVNNYYKTLNFVQSNEKSS